MRSTLIEQLGSYTSEFAIEVEFVKHFQQLLQHERAFYRDHLPGHITGSAWIVDPTFQFTLLTHHAKLNRWLQPGGHADGDEDVLRVASREANEETGLSSVTPASQNIFDIDIHSIPARKDFPSHDHYDLRFLFTADMNEPLVITSESNDLKWIPIKELGALVQDNPSIMRMALKLKEYQSK